MGKLGEEDKEEAKPAFHKINFVPAFHKTAISRKTKSFGTFCPFFLDSMDLSHYPSNYSKRFIEKLSLQILICS